MTEDQAKEAHKVGHSLEIKLRSWPITERSILQEMCSHINVIVLALKEARGQEPDIEELRAALKPFADYADPRQFMPADMVITQGSPMAKRQLTMGDCYTARRVMEGKNERRSAETDSAK
jgi:hypothetical protein